jgi:hypothetical protein
MPGEAEAEMEMGSLVMPLAGDSSLNEVDLACAQRLADAIHDAIVAVGKEVPDGEGPDAVAIELALLAVHANFLVELAPDPLEAAGGAGEELQRIVAVTLAQQPAHQARLGADRRRPQWPPPTGRGGPTIER